MSLMTPSLVSRPPHAPDTLPNGKERVLMEVAKVQ